MASYALQRTALRAVADLYLDVSLHSRAMNHSKHLAALLLSLVLLVGTGCKHTDPYDAAVYSIFGPVAIAAMPGYAFAEGTRILSESGKKRVYLPAGLTEAQVEEQIAQLPGKSGRRIHWKKDGTQLWRVTRGDVIVYAKLKDGMTLEHSE